MIYVHTQVISVLREKIKWPIYVWEPVEYLILHYYSNIDPNVFYVKGYGDRSRIVYREKLFEKIKKACHKNIGFVILIFCFHHYLQVILIAMEIKEYYI